MELRNLQYFISVYQELSFSKAAQKCFVSQPSISAAIGQLEMELKRQLFIRHAKGASPTQAGKTFYPAAVKVLNEINAMQGLFHECLPLVPLRIALMPFLSGKRIGLIINELIISLPELDLTVVDWNEDADARIISRSMALQNEAFHNLWVDDYVLAMSIEHPLAEQKEIILQDLNGQPFISSKFCDARDSWNYALQKYGVMFVSKATVNTQEYALDLVAAGLGVAVVPSHSASHRTDIVIRKIENVKLERVIGLAYQKDHPLPSQLLTAVEKAREKF
jgi:LysR family transcriptional regulator, benzoate and cis,cis-muconate-responsive activator of ben and cat genes